MCVIVTKALGNTWTFDKMFEIVKSELEARERACMLSSKPTSKPPYAKGLGSKGGLTTKVL